MRYTRSLLFTKKQNTCHILGANLMHIAQWLQRVSELFWSMKKLFTQSSSLFKGAYQMKEREARHQWSRMCVLIWDEIVMTGQALFAKACNRLRQFLCTGHDEDLRIHIITAKDFTQLSPCFEKFVFESSQVLPNDMAKVERPKIGKVRAEQTMGFHLWRKFEIVINWWKTCDMQRILTMEAY